MYIEVYAVWIASSDTLTMWNRTAAVYKQYDKLNLKVVVLQIIVHQALAAHELVFSSLNAKASN